VSACHTGILRGTRGRRCLAGRAEDPAPKNPGSTADRPSPPKHTSKTIGEFVGIFFGKVAEKCLSFDVITPAAGPFTRGASRRLVLCDGRQRNL
jgi:hypothetical protein